LICSGDVRIADREDTISTPSKRFFIVGGGDTAATGKNPLQNGG